MRLVYFYTRHSYLKGALGRDYHVIMFSSMCGWYALAWKALEQSICCAEGGGCREVRENDKIHWNTMGREDPLVCHKNESRRK